MVATMAPHLFRISAWARVLIKRELRAEYFKIVIKKTGGRERPPVKSPKDYL
jgi:hypothetical protein